MKLIIGGWFTPDYRVWKERLARDLDQQNLPYIFLEVPKPRGQSWEAVTRMKARMASRLLEEAGDRTLLMLDVDARIRGLRDQVLKIADIQTDIALRLSGKISKSRGTTKMHPWSGTLVLRPTHNTRLLLSYWEEAGIDAPKYATDEATLGQAMAQVPGLTITLLPEHACAGKSTSNPVIHHPHRTGKRSKMIMIKHFFNRLMML